MGERQQHLASATALIEQKAGAILRASSIYETDAWGMEDQSAFLNQVLLIETILPAEALLNTLLEIEATLGRLRLMKFGPRIIDLDILLFNDDTLHSESLSVPHPALPDRRFALYPLFEIAPDLVHPTSKKTIAQLLQECSDTLEVRLFKQSAN